MARQIKKLGRGKRGWITRRANAALKKNHEEVSDKEIMALTHRIRGQRLDIAGAGMANNAPQMGTQEIPGQGEIIGGHDDAATNAIIHYARKHDGFEHVKRMLQVEQQKSRMQGIEVERERATKLREIRDRCISERIVCGFVAEVKEMERALGGLPYELIWNMNSFTLTKVVEALLAAGYRPEGRVRAAE